MLESQTVKKHGRRDAASFHCNELNVKRTTMGVDMLRKNVSLGMRRRNRQ